MDILDVWELPPAAAPVQERGWGGPGCGCEALAGAGLALLPGLGGSAHLLRAPGEVHPLLVHPLGLDPLDEAEEVFVGHGGAAGQHVRRRAALVVDPGGLRRHGHAGRRPRLPRPWRAQPSAWARRSEAPGTPRRQCQLRRASLGISSRAQLGALTPRTAYSAGELLGQPPRPAPKATRPWCVHEPQGQGGAAAPGAGGAECPRAPAGQGAERALGLSAGSGVEGPKPAEPVERACVWAGLSVGAGFEAPRTRPELHFPLLCGKQCHSWELSSFLHGGCDTAPSPAISLRVS